MKDHARRDGVLNALLRRTDDPVEQCRILDKRERHRHTKYRDPGFQTPDDYTRAIMWVSSNCWRPLMPVDMPWPSWWTLFSMAKSDTAGFMRDYVKPLIVNTTAQRTVKEKVKVEKDEGGDKLEGLLNGSA